MSQSPAPARPDAPGRGRHRRVIPFTSRAGFARLVRLGVAFVAITALTTGGALVAPQATAAPKPNAAVKSQPTLKLNSRGAAVKWVQASLNVKPRNGVYTKRTAAAVRAFQKRQKLRPSGVMTVLTWRKLGVLEPRLIKARAARTAARADRPGTAAFSKKVTRVAASTARGARYSYGSTGPRSFDCSGYVGYVIRKATGKKLPRTSGAMRSATKRISRSSARPGDLVFVHSGSRVSHVSIYAGGNHWWEASNPRTGVGKHKAWTSRVSYGRVR